MTDKRRIQVDEAQAFLLRYMDTMMEVYRLFQDRSVPPRDGYTLFRIMAEVERKDPDTDHAFLEVARRVLAERRKEKAH